MTDIALRVFWNNEPIPLNRKIDKAAINVPFGVMITNPSSGGGDYNFSVKELDLQAYVSEVPSMMQITSDVDNLIVGSNTIGTITLNQSPSLSAYFKADRGKFLITVNTTDQLFCLLENVASIPQTKTTMADIQQQDESFLIGIIYVQGQLGIQIGDFFHIPPFLSVVVENPLSTETIEIEIIDDKTLSFSNKNVLLGTYQHTQNLGHYFHNIAEMNLAGGDKIQFDLSLASSTIFNLPPNTKDGEIFHLISGGQLLNKVLHTDDYIQVYNNQQDIIVIRVPETVLPVLPSSQSRIPLKVNLTGGVSSQIMAWWDSELRALFLCGSIYVISEDWSIEIELIDDIPFTYTSYMPFLFPIYENQNIVRLQINSSSQSNGIRKIILGYVDSVVLGTSYYLPSSILLDAVSS
ncbi:hypothetical protein [Acinetobacter junii]|uniref:hypothetical protein n=1 Tax=Acinetobacter junii TaxID=40215 RepID=UPI00301B462A